MGKNRTLGNYSGVDYFLPWRPNYAIMSCSYCGARWLIFIREKSTKRYSNNCPRCLHRHTWRFGQPSAKESGNPRGGGRTGRCTILQTSTDVHSEALKALTWQKGPLKYFMRLEHRYCKRISLSFFRWIPHQSDYFPFLEINPKLRASVWLPEDTHYVQDAPC